MAEAIDLHDALTDEGGPSGSGEPTRCLLPFAVLGVCPRVHASAGVSLAAEAAELRSEIASALYAAGGGHYGGSLSVLDVVLTLYRRQLRVAVAEPTHRSRDRFILSKGHAAIALYAVLRRLGFFDEPLESYARIDSPLEGHPDMTALAGVDFSTGSLGQGLSVGLGMALALEGGPARVWAVLGDGECQEGQVWEAAMLAARYRVSNLHAVVDANGFQECKPPHRQPGTAAPVDSLSERWAAFGWRVFHVDGHDQEALARCFARMASTPRGPSVAIARTVKGKGFPLMERDPLRFHCATLTEAEHELLLSGGS